MDNNVKKLTSALNIYQKYEQDSLTLNDLKRTDMHFRFKDGSDFVIEESGIHCINPFKNDIKELLKWSRNPENLENFENSIKAYSDYFNSIKSNYDSNSEIRLRPYFGETINERGKFKEQSESDYLFETYKKIVKNSDDMLSVLKNQINNIREIDDSVEAQAELDHRIRNVFEILYCTHNKDLDNPMLKLYLNDLGMTNQVTILQSFKERETKKNSKGFEISDEEDDYSRESANMEYETYKHKFRIYSIGEMIEMLRSKNINKFKTKERRPFILSNTTGRRLVGDQVYENWNGLQVIDIDLKNSTDFCEMNTDASEIRDTLFKYLQRYTWFLGITLSSSKRGLHVYTKVSRMHHLTDDQKTNINIQKYWYQMSYIQKYASICFLLRNKCAINDVFDTKKRIIDSAMAKVQQGIAMNYDPESKWSSNFVDLYPCFGYHVPPDENLSDSDWITHPHILKTFSSWFMLHKRLDEDNADFTYSDLEIKISTGKIPSMDKVKQIEMSKLPQGSKYDTRWRICNTLAYVYGDIQLTYELAQHILQARETGTVDEINAYIRSAIANEKQPSNYTIKMLNDLGLSLKIDSDSVKLLKNEQTEKIRHLIESSSEQITMNTHKPNYHIQLGGREYLGMRMPDILGAMEVFKLNVMESAPNTGKTEFFKKLATKVPVCLVIPFTSTIESKIVNDKTMTDIFDIYYGDKSISNIKEGRSCVMTFDKFSTLPKNKYSWFRYIAIDESHLCFTSVYRLPVVSKTIENIRTFLEQDSSFDRAHHHVTMSVNNALSIIQPERRKQTNTEMITKFIMMTGTITGELDYFSHYGLLNYVKVSKRHPFEKNVEFILSETSATKKIKICKSIADAIIEGKKIIHPTNMGDTYVEQIIAGVEVNLGREVRYEYYKRANSDEDFMTDINKNTTVKDIDILFCSDYLSVGIDIKDVGEFEVVFNNDFTAESIEQFNNRLRSTDIHSKIFYDYLEDDGTTKPNILSSSKIEYYHSDELQKMIEDEELVAKVQKSIQLSDNYHVILGELFSRYFIQDHSGQIKYVRASFEIEQFEHQYTRIAKTLVYIKETMIQKYGYDAKISFIDEYSEEIKERYKEILTDARNEHVIAKDSSFRTCVEFLSDTKIYKKMLSHKITLVKDSSDIENEFDEVGLFFGYDKGDDCFKLTYHKRHKHTIENAIKFVKKFRRLYSLESIMTIMENHENKMGTLNKKELQRYEKLIYLIDKDQGNSIADITIKILDVLYSYIPNESTQLDKMEYEIMRGEIRNILNDNLLEVGATIFQSQKRKTQIAELVDDFINTLTKKRNKKNDVILSLRKILPFDSNQISEKIEMDAIFSRIILNKDLKKNEINVMETHEIHPQHILYDDKTTLNLSLL